MHAATPQLQPPIHRATTALWFYRALLYGGLLLVGLAGSKVTTVLVIAVGLLTLWGDLDGAARHILRMLGFAAAVVFAPLLAAPLAGWLAPQTGLPLTFVQIGSAVVVGLLVILLAGAVAKRVARRIHRHPVGNAVDRGFGTLVGAGEGALVVALTCWTVGLFEPELDRIRSARAASSMTPPAGPADLIVRSADALRNDPIGRALMDHNALANVPLLQQFQQAARLALDPAALDRAVRSGGSLEEFVRLPVVKRHLDGIYADPQMRDAIRRRDLFTIMQSRQFTAMLSDQELHKTVVANWDTLSASISPNHPLPAPGESPAGSPAALSVSPTGTPIPHSQQVPKPQLAPTARSNTPR